MNFNAGDRVRLTGKYWEDSYGNDAYLPPRGSIQTIAGENGTGPYFYYKGNLWYVERDFEAELVPENLQGDIDTLESYLEDPMGGRAGDVALQAWKRIKEGL